MPDTQDGAANRRRSRVGSELGVMQLQMEENVYEATANDLDTSNVPGSTRIYTCSRSQ
jgi:hypothetical protein